MSDNFSYDNNPQFAVVNNLPAVRIWYSGIPGGICHNINETHPNIIRSICLDAFLVGVLRILHGTTGTIILHMSVRWHKPMMRYQVHIPVYYPDDPEKVNGSALTKLLNAWYQVVLSVPGNRVPE